MTRASLVTAPAGMGKSWNVLRVLASKTDEKAVVFFPSHNDIDEKLADFISLGGTGGAPYVGISKGCELEVPKLIGSSGSIRRRICPVCDLRTRCRAHMNNLKARVIFAALPAYEFLNEQGVLAGRTVIIDEWPEPMITTEFTSAELEKFKRFPTFATPLQKWFFVLSPAVKLLERVVEQEISARRHDPQLRYGVVVTDAQLRATANSVLGQLSPRRRGLVKRARHVPERDVRTYSASEILEDGAALDPRWFLRSDVVDLFDAVFDGGAAQLHLRSSSSGDITAVFKVFRSRGLTAPRDGKLVLLDATGLYLRAVLEAFLGQLRIVGSFQVQAQQGTVVLRRWLACASLSRRSMIKDNRATSDGRKLFQRVIQAVDEEAQDELGIHNLTLGILTFKPIADELNGNSKGSLRRWRRQIRPGLRVLDAGYFGRDERATNAFEEVDVLAVVGDPFPNITEMNAYASAMETLTGAVVDPQDLVCGVTASNINQALARARAEYRTGTTMLVYAGRLLPPEWKPGEFEEIQLPGPRRDAEDIRKVASKILYRHGVSSAALGKELGEALMRGFPYKGLSNRENLALKNIASGWRSSKRRQFQANWTEGCRRAGAIRVGKFWTHPGTTKKDVRDAVVVFRKDISP